MDYRLKENRREAFIRWYAWSLKYDDCDPAVWTIYITDTATTMKSESGLRGSTVTPTSFQQLGC